MSAAGIPPGRTAARCALDDSALLPVLCAAEVGDRSAVARLAALAGFPVAERSSAPFVTALFAGMVAALKAGHSSLFCDMLLSPAIVPATLFGAFSVPLQVAACTAPSEAVLDALLARRPSPLPPHALDAITRVYRQLSPARRDKLAPPGSGVLAQALARALGGEGRVGDDEVAALLRAVPAASAPALLEVLAAPMSSPLFFTARHREGHDLPRFMRFAAILRPRCLAPGSPPSVEEVLSAAAGLDRWDVALARWAGWMASFESLADGVPWHDLHRHPLPEPARAAFWVILATSMASAGRMMDVSPDDRVAIMEALVKDILSFAALPQHDDLSMGGPDVLLPEMRGVELPLHVFLRAWGPPPPILVEHAQAAGSNEMLGRLVWFGASLNQVLPGGHTLLQDIFLKSRCGLAVSPGAAIVPSPDWTALSADGTSIAHLLFRDDLPADPAAATSCLENILDILALAAPFLPASTWQATDASGRTPWTRLCAFRSHFLATGNQAAERMLSSWLSANPDIAMDMEGGCFRAVLSGATSPNPPRPRL